jgi:hypothetical protein
MRASPGLRSNAAIYLSGLVWAENRSDLYETCLGYLTDFWDPDPIFPKDELRQFGWTAILLHALGNVEDAKPPARRALAAASKTSSKAAKHPTLGLADEGDLRLIEQLRRIGAENPSPTARGGWNLLAKLSDLLKR